jgi:hypothetical protein
MFELVFKLHPFCPNKFGLIRWFYRGKKYSISLQPRLFYYRKYDSGHTYLTILGIYYHSRYGQK